MKRYFELSCHALIISAFLALALTGRLDAPSILLFGIGVSISAYRTFHGLRPLLSTRAAFLLSCGYIAFFLIDNLILSRSFITATIHLVLYLELAKLFQEKHDRDYLYLILLSFLMILAASSLTIDMSFVATLFLFLVALVSTLMSFEMYRSERQTASPVSTLAMPLTGMSLWATVWIIVTGVILFLLIPRVGTGYFSRATAPSLLLSGFTESVQLGTIGQVKLNSAVVMRTRQLRGTPFGVLKWRGIALDAFDGRNWFQTDRAHDILRASPDGQYWIRPVENTGEIVRFEILQERLGTNAMFGPQHVRAVSGNMQGIEIDSDDGVFIRLPGARRAQYQVLSEVPKRAPLLDVGLEDEPIPPSVASKYLQLPNNMDPRITELATEITSRARSIMEKAAHVEAYLKRNYRYSLVLNWTPGQQPLSTFLFEAKSGHCEYFASSMAIVLRAAGIPTRLVNGFLMGEYNPVGDSYIVRQSDAHSWVEVYIPSRGWVEFDPTPADSSQRDMSLAIQLGHYIDAMELYWNTYILVYDTTTQMQLFRSAQDQVQSIQNSVRRRTDRWALQTQILADRFSLKLRNVIETFSFWFGVVLLIAAVTAFRHRRVLKTRFHIWQLRRGRGAVNDDVVQEMFYRAARLAERGRSKRRPAETWREWIFGLPDPNRRSMLARALEVFEKSKYGRKPVSASEFTLLEETIRELKM